MIILKLRGALGNQMFQYAFARALAIEKKQLLFIDDKSLENYAESFGKDKASRMYKLGYFNIKGILLPFKMSRLISTLKYLGRKFEKIEKIDNQNPIYDEKLVEKALNTKDIILDGHWFSQKYFSKYTKDIATCFDLNKYAKVAEEKLQEEINNCNSVFLHIRRADYVSNPEVAAQQGIITLDYYNKAIQYIKNRVDDIKIFVFSDDMEWAKKNLKYDVPIRFIEGDVNNPISNVFLMSICKHSIIANSTFSWWAAWLNKNKKKIVISPRYWFANDNPSSKDIIPEEWIKL